LDSERSERVVESEPVVRSRGSHVDESKPTPHLLSGVHAGAAGGAAELYLAVPSRGLDRVAAKRPRVSSDYQVEFHQDTAVSNNTLHLMHAASSAKPRVAMPGIPRDFDSKCMMIFVATSQAGFITRWNSVNRRCSLFRVATTTHVHFMTLGLAPPCDSLYNKT
jgi:hypothetical protein